MDDETYLICAVVTSNLLTISILHFQEHVIEKRYARFLKVLERGGTFLRGQLKTRDSVTDEGMIKLKMDILKDTSDLESASVSASGW